MPNDALLDKSVQWRINSGKLEVQEPRYQSIAEAILSSGLATGVVRPLSAGKEAEVYLAEYKESPIAIKIYRLYRTPHRGGRPVKADTMGWRAAHEFELLHQAWRRGIRVPAPARRIENMFSMRYLGNDDGPAPRLTDVELDQPRDFLDGILMTVESLARAGIVHGDLSSYNVLVHEGEDWVIDFSEGVRVDRLGEAPWRRLTQARDLLTRGLEALQKYFRRYDVAFEASPVVDRIIQELDIHGVLG